jgi:hypothetical protein
MATLLTACGYVSDPLPPALNIPQRVTDLRASQQGDRLVIEFTIPPLTTDDLGLRIGDIELRASASDPGTDLSTWPETADRIDVQASEPGPVRREVSAAAWSGKPIWIAVRVASHKRKWSEWSNVASIEVIPELQPPRDIRVESAAQGVRVTWKYPDNRLDRETVIFRRGPGERELVEAAVAGGGEWVDPAAVFGQVYEYELQSRIGQARSARSGSVRILHEDKFPPAVPAGLAALAGLTGIELAWEPNRESDLAGYRVYRAEGDAPLQALGGPVGTPSFRDPEARAGVKYRYAVSALDQRGNESTPSQPVEIEAPR